MGTSKTVLTALATAFVVLSPRPAGAELCQNCRGQAYVMAVGVCESCGGATTSTAFRLCPTCSAQQGKCERCLAVLVAQPTTPPDPLDATRPGTHNSGKWTYRLSVASGGASGSGLRGVLSYDGEALPDAELNDRYRTPWGMMYWVGDPKTGTGPRGWMPSPAAGVQREGKLLTPFSARADEIRLTAADDGKTVAAAAGKTIVVSLAGNMTTGYGWQTAEVTGKAIEVLGEPTYATPQRPGMVGVGGTFTFRLKAAQSGTATLKLVYVRPWEKDTPPARTFTVTVEVKDPASSAEGSGSTPKPAE